MFSSQVLVVQGWWSRNSWGFPKGKVNEVEQAHECAVREVIEETNCDVSQLIDSRHFLEKVINDQGRKQTKGFGRRNVRLGCVLNLYRVRLKTCP